MGAEEEDIAASLQSVRRRRVKKYHIFSIERLAPGARPYLQSGVKEHRVVT